MSLDFTPEFVLISDTQDIFVDQVKISFYSELVNKLVVFLHTLLTRDKLHKDQIDFGM